MSRQYTREELIRILQSKEFDGKISVQDLAELVFDEKFPDELYEQAKNELINYRNDLKRFKEAGAALQPYWEELNTLRKEIADLSKNIEKNNQEILIKREQVRKIEDVIRFLEAEFDMLNKRIGERKQK